MTPARRTSLASRVLRVGAVVLIAASITRIMFTIHSTRDLRQSALALPITVVIVAALLVGACWPILAYQRLRGRRLAERFPGAAVWVVSTGLATRYLVVGSKTVAIVAGNGAGRTWSLDQVRGATLQQIPAGIGLIRRSGMRLALGVHTHHETVDLLFPKWLGLAVSVPDTKAAVAMVQQASHQPPQN